MADDIFDEDLTGSVDAAWPRFIDVTEPIRPELFRFALKLTRNPFDAEDLVHDALLKAFASLAFQYGRIKSPRSYLFRTLSNLWIDEMRRARPQAGEDAMENIEDKTSPPAEQGVEVREAAEIVMHELSPRERAAIVLKEVCEFTHGEIADLLSTSEGAIKIAFHRAKKRIKEISELPKRPSRVSSALVEEFVKAMQAHDVTALKKLMVSSLEAETFPSGVGVGVEHHEKEGWIHGCMYHHIGWREESGEPFPLQLEIQEIDGEPVVLVMRDWGEGSALEEVWRFEEEDGRIARVRDYGFSPDLVSHVADILRLPFRPVAYRFKPDVYEEMQKEPAD